MFKLRSEWNEESIHKIVDLVFSAIDASMGTIFDDDGSKYQYIITDALIRGRKLAFSGTNARVLIHVVEEINRIVDEYFIINKFCVFSITNSQELQNYSDRRILTLPICETYKVNGHVLPLLQPSDTASRSMFSVKEKYTLAYSQWILDRIYDSLKDVVGSIFNSSELYQFTEALMNKQTIVIYSPCDSAVVPELAKEINSIFKEYFNVETIVYSHTPENIELLDRVLPGGFANTAIIEVPLMDKYYINQHLVLNAQINNAITISSTTSMKSRLMLLAHTCGMVSPIIVPFNPCDDGSDQVGRMKNKQRKGNK